MFVRKDKYQDDSRWCNACQRKHHILQECPYEDAWHEWHIEDRVGLESEYAWQRRGIFLTSLTRPDYTVACPSCGLVNVPVGQICRHCNFAEQGESNE